MWRWGRRGFSEEKADVETEAGQKADVEEDNDKEIPPSGPLLPLPQSLRLEVATHANARRQPRQGGGRCHTN